MYSQDSISSTITSQVMDRMRSLGSFTIAKREDHASQIIRRLDLSQVSPSDASEGFFQLVEEGRIRSGEIDAPLGNGGSTTSEPIYERQIVYSLAE